MFKVISKLIPCLILWVIFAFVIFRIPYPETIIQANIAQLSAFFISLYLALSFTFNIFSKNIFVSSSISLGIVFMLILQALNSFNIVTGVLTVIAIYLLVSYFRKRNGESLTKGLKIPKLTRFGRGRNQK